MTRGVAHPPELRAQVVAAVLAGMTMGQAALQFGLDKSLVSRWVATDATEYRSRQLFAIEGLLLDLVAEHATTLRAELQAAARPDWLQKQSAAELAQLVVAQRDTLIRLLAGFRPVIDEPDQPQLGPAQPPEAEQ
jgi:transposase-like protein